MARLVLPIAGAAAGFALGGPAGAQWGWMLGGLANGLLPTKKKVNISETGGQSTSEGAPRAIVYGTALVTGNLIDAGPITKRETTESAKGGGPSTTTTTYTRTYAIRMCEGPIAGLLAVKQDGAIVYDVRTGSSFDADNTAFLARCTIYLGDEDQLPDADLEAVHGAGEVPAYRGSAYVVFADDDLTSRQGSVPQYEFIVSGTTSVNAVQQTLTGVTATSTVTGVGGSGNIASGLATGAFMDDAAAGTGSVYLAFFNFYVDTIYSADIYIDYTLSIGTETMMTGTLHFPTAFDQSVMAQISSDVHDHSAVEMSFQVYAGPPGPDRDLSDFDGSYTMRMVAITSGAYSSPTDRAIYSDELIFGVVLDSNGDPFYADYIFELQHIWGQAASWVYQGDEDADGIFLHEIVDDVHDRCGADAADTSALTDRVEGLVLGSADYSGADVLNTLRAPYFFDRAEVDGEIVYTKRGAATVATLTIDDLVAEPDQAERQAQIEYPAKLHLSFQSLPQNYEVAQATSARYSVDVRVIGEQSLQVPVVLSEEEAAQIAAKLHKVAWADAEGEIRFSVPMDFIRLVPTDCIALTLRGLTRRLRIEKIEDADGIRTLVCMIDRQSAYTSAATSDVLPTPTAPVSRVPGATELAVMDMPAIDDSHDRLLYYVAVSGERVGWRSSVVQRSLDAGASFTTVDTLASASIMGELTATIAEASEYYTDTTNTVTVQLYRTTQTVESVSETAFLSRGGAFAVEKAAGGWEIMQYRDAVDNGTGSYTLSVLHRGLLNSGPSAHTVGQRVVFLPPGAVTNAQVAWIGADLVHRGVSSGTSPEEAAEQTAEFVGRSQTEWPVASLTVTSTDSDPDNYFDVSLLLHCDGADGSTTFTDNSPTPKVVTAGGNAQVDTAWFEYGTGSALFDGTGDYLSTPDHEDFDFGSGDFTIEMVVRPNSIVGTHHLIAKYQTVGLDSPFVIFQNGSRFSFYSSGNGSTWNLVSDLLIGTGLSTGTRYHMAVVREGNVWSTYLDGVRAATTTQSGTVYATTQPVVIGARSTSGTDAYNGWIDEIRITKGVARYSGASFTPPTAAYPDTAEGDTITLNGSWAPRHRFGTDDNPIASVHHAGYRVTVDDGVTSDTFDQTTATLTYDATALVSPVTVTVASLNRYTGAGPSESVEVTL